jgi:hypothetical protein
MSQTTGDRPSHSSPLGLGWIHPHVPDRKTANTTRASPRADRKVPTRSSRGEVSPRGSSSRRRANATIPTTTITSPAKTHRQEAYVVSSPPMSGPAATAMAPAEATRP